MAGIEQPDTPHLVRIRAHVSASMYPEGSQTRLSWAWKLRCLQRIDGLVLQSRHQSLPADAKQISSAE